MNNLVMALAEGIRDAGVRHYANYPGFHSNELHAALGGGVTSTDEKNAFAFAWGCSMAGHRAAVSFKNVGLNDAADAFLGAHFVGCRAGLVLFLFDDCDIQHSQNRIDVRHYQGVYGGLWLEPRSVPEAYRLARTAFGISERFGLPVVIRVTNILFDQGLRPATWQRTSENPPVFARLSRLADASPYVVHPSEARRMERDLAEKNARIAEYVETLYDDAIGAPDAVVFGAKRGVSASNPLRLFTLPLPQRLLRRHFKTEDLPSLKVYEHGPTPYVAREVARLVSGADCVSVDMANYATVRPKYHNHDFMERLFAALRAVDGGVVCGDLGGYTMDPSRTVELCLCYGVAPAVTAGYASADPGAKVFCVIGDAAYLHSGQQCLYEMVARGVSCSVFVLENGGALGTGGQYIPGDLCTHPEGVSFREIDYAALSASELDRFVADLPANGINLVVVHTHEEDCVAKEDAHGH